MNKLLKTIASGLLMILALTTATPAMADAGEGAVAAFLMALLTTTTFKISGSSFDTVKSQSLIDQAYAGEGEKLEALSTASNKPIETIADTIVALDKDGKLDANQPAQMAQTIAAAIK